MLPLLLLLVCPLVQDQLLLPCLLLLWPVILLLVVIAVS